MTFQRAYLGLGSNLGDREGHLREAIARIAALPHTRILQESSIIETAPWGKTDQPDFLNMVVGVETLLPPHELLRAVLRIEEEMGRAREEHWGARIIDIDVLIYDDIELDTPELRLPHPLITQRRFVLESLAEIAPELVIRGKRVREWLGEIS